MLSTIVSEHCTSDRPSPIRRPACRILELGLRSHGSRAVADKGRRSSDVLSPSDPE